MSIPTGNVKGTVFEDKNGDGIQVTYEPGIGGMKLLMINSTGSSRVS
jgi:hypothetical protein